MRPVIPIIVCSIFFACQRPSGGSHIPLTLTAIYSPDSVLAAMNGGDAKAADNKLQEAIDCLKRKKDTIKSIGLFKEAIMLKPTSRAYYELAGALAGAHRYEEEINALHLAERLGYTPLSNVMFRYAYAYANTGEDQDDAMHYMELAIQMGYAHPQQFLQKAFFPGLSNARSFNGRYNEALRGGPGLNNTEKTLWETYSVQFPGIALPVIVNRQWLRDHYMQGGQIAWQYERFIPDMRANKFAREEETEFYFVGILEKNPVFTAVLYSAEDVDADNPVNLTMLYLVTYSTAAGELIDKMLVAGKKDLASPFRVFSIQPGLQFTVQEFKEVYKNNPDSAGYDSSNISAEQPMPLGYYRIAASGLIEKAGAPLALR